MTAPGVVEVPVLDPQLWDLWLPVLLAVLVASVVLEVVKYRVGRWTPGLAAANTVLNAAFAGIVLWLATGRGMLNPALEGTLPAALDSLVTTLPWVIALIAAIDTASGWWNVLRAGGPAGS